MCQDPPYVLRTPQKYQGDEMCVRGSTYISRISSMFQKYHRFNRIILDWFGTQETCKGHQRCGRETIYISERLLMSEGHLTCVRDIRYL